MHSLYNNLDIKSNIEQYKYATIYVVFILLIVRCSIFIVHCDVSRIFDPKGIHKILKRMAKDSGVFL